MKDKEKQIEEMAKERLIEEQITEMATFMETTWTKNIIIGDKWKWFAEELLKHYQPKLPEDSVVLNGSKLAKLVEEVRQEFEHKYKDKVILDKEEYNKVENTFKMSISDHIAYLRENKRLKEDVQALIGMRFERFNLITKEESDKKVERARKETAEKLIKFVSEHCDNETLIWQLDEFVAKQFEVEIME